MSINAKINKYQDIVKCSADAILYFEIWGIIRYFFYVFSDFSLFCEKLEIDPESMTTKISIIFSVVIFGFLDFLVRLFISKKAIKVSFGKARSLPFYLCLAAYFCFELYGDIYSCITYIREGEINNMIIFTVIELTFFFALTEIFISCIRLNRILKDTSANAAIKEN